MEKIQASPERNIIKSKIFMGYIIFLTILGFIYYAMNFLDEYSDIGIPSYGAQTLNRITNKEGIDFTYDLK